MYIKSVPDAERFKAFGAPKVIVTGETRFDQDIPAHLTSATSNLRFVQSYLFAQRMVVAFASVVEGEDAAYIEAMHAVINHHSSHNMPAPLFVYVPRAPERFYTAWALLKKPVFGSPSAARCLARILSLYRMILMFC